MNPSPKTVAPDSALLVTLTVEQLRELLMEAIQGAKTAQQDAERWLDAKEAAEMLSLSEDWLYRHHKKLPFAHKLGPKVLRFSYRGLIKWMATRKAL